MDRLVGIIYPYDQETTLERQLAARVKVEKMVSPTSINAERYDKILVVGNTSLLAKESFDKLRILDTAYSGLIGWVEDTPGVAAEVISDLPKRSRLGATQTQVSSDIPMLLDQTITILFQNQSDVFSTWKMRVKKGGSGVCVFTVYDVDAGGKLLRTYDLFLSEFTDDWFTFRLPNPIFKAKKRLAVSLRVKNLNGEPPRLCVHQGWSEYQMVVGGKKSDFIPCFESF